MAQMINLLNSIPKAPVDNSLFSPQNTHKILMAMAFAFLIHLSVVIVHRISEGRAYDKATTEAMLAQEVMDDMKAKYPDPKKAVIETRAKDIEQQIVLKRNMLNYLKGDTIGSHGYTPFLEALSKNIIPGVWLTMIDIDMSNNFVGLKGLSISGPLVVKFVDQLSKDPVFKEMKMGSFKLEKSDEKSSFMAFQLSNQVGREPGVPMWNLSKDKINTLAKDLKVSLGPLYEKYQTLQPRQRSQYLLFGVLFGLLFIQIVAISPIENKTKELKSKTAALLLTTEQNRQASQHILSEVQQSIANPRSESAKNLMKQIETLNEGLSAYNNATVSPAEMGEVLRELLAQDKKLVFISMSSLPSTDVLNSEEGISDSSVIEKRPKLFKRGIQIVFEGTYESTYSYLKKLEGYKKKIFWDDFIYEVKQYPIAQVTLKVYTLSHEESWIGS